MWRGPGFEPPRVLLRGLTLYFACRSQVAQEPPATKASAPRQREKNATESLGPPQLRGPRAAGTRGESRADPQRTLRASHLSRLSRDALTSARETRAGSELRRDPAPAFPGPPRRPLARAAAAPRLRTLRARPAAPRAVPRAPPPDWPAPLSAGLALSAAANRASPQSREPHRWKWWRRFFLGRCVAAILCVATTGPLLLGECVRVID